ncbi:MAG: DUF721 domain-containing protein [Actinomycetota bacterium]|nr:DUF721 domain-containing protein [Actinomycetota bacterium]
MNEGPARLKDLLGSATKKLGLKAPVETARIWSEWRRIVGDAVAAHAEPTSLKNGILRVRADSPTWATEISYLSAEIRTKINARVGSSLVHRVDVWTGPPPQGSRSSTGAADSPQTGSCASPKKDGSKASKVDPETAFERARRAWAEATGRSPSRGSKAPPENPEKPW